MFNPLGGGFFSGSRPWMILVGAVSDGPSTSSPPVPPVVSLVSSFPVVVFSAVVLSAVDEDELLPPPQAARAKAAVNIISATTVRRRNPISSPIVPLPARSGRFSPRTAGPVGRPLSGPPSPSLQKQPAGWFASGQTTEWLIFYPELLSSALPGV